MRQRLPYLAFPAACLAVLVSLVACGGSGSNSVDTTPTVVQAAAAVNQASNADEGAVATAKVLNYFGDPKREVYQKIPADTRQQFNEAFGSALAFDNQKRSGLTYGQALDSFAETFNTDTTVEVALTALNTDLGTAATDANTPGRKELLLLIELEGANASATKPLSVAGTLSLARWYAYRFATTGTALTRSACTDRCHEAYDDALNNVQVAINATIATIDAYVESLLALKQIPGTEPYYEAIDDVAGQQNQLKAELIQVRTFITEAYESARNSCYQACHQQS